MTAQTYSVMLVPNYNSVQYFTNLPKSNYFKIYTDEGITINGKCVTFFDDDSDINEMIRDKDKILETINKNNNMNIFNQVGVEYIFDNPKKLYFYAKNIEHPVKIYVDIEI